MNVLMLTGATAGGITNHIIELGEKLIEHDNTIVVGCIEGEIVEDMRQHFKTYTLEFFSKNPLIVLKTLFKLKRIIVDNNIDIVHCHYRANALYMQVLSHFFRIKYVWTNHLIPIPHDFFHRKLTYYGSKAIAIGMESKNYIHKNLNIPIEDIRIIYHGVNLDEFNFLDKNLVSKTQWSIDPNSRVILLLGRLTPVKGHKFLLDAVKNMDNITVVFTGIGSSEYRQELEEYINELGLKNKVKFVGFINSKRILSIADVMVLPSKMEGFGISVLESFAMKVPVVRTKTAGYEDTKDFCLGVEYGDTEMLRQAIENALDKEKTMPMVERAYLKIKKEWNTDVMVKEYMDLYKECLLDE